MQILEISFLIPAFLLNTSGVESDAQVNYVEASFRLQVDVTYLNSHCVESTIMEKNSVEWSVKLCKTNDTAGWFNKANSNVDLYLKCSPLNGRLCTHEAIVKLLPRDDRCNEPIVKRLSKREFSNADSTAAIKGFVGWSYFYDNFVSDDYVIFEIDIRTNACREEHVAEPQNEPNIYEVGSRIHFMLDDVSNLQERISPEITVGGIRWNVIVEKRDTHLAVYLEGNEYDFEQNSAYKVDAHFKLLTYDSSVQSKNRDFTHIYRWNSTKEGFERFLKFSDFIDNDKHYTRDNKANLLVEFTVQEQKQSPVARDDASERFDCSACLKEFCSGDIYSANCGHLYCQPCFDETIQNSLVCPECGSSICDGIHPLNGN